MKEETKNHFKECVRNYFIIVTLINLAMFILGSIFKSYQKFGYEAFLFPLIYGVLASIPGLIIPKKRELSVKQLIFRELLGWFLISFIIIGFMFAGRPFSRELFFIGIGVSLSVLVISILINLIIWFLDSKTAKSMTEDLKAFQKKNV